MNPITTLRKLVQSKPLADQLGTDVKTMNKSNWKTNTIGAITLLAGLAHIWVPNGVWQDRVNSTTAVLAGAGLIAAKDHDK